MTDSGGPHFTIDGQEFKGLVGAALSWLRRHQEAINALNVFPVPDGDTGTNMVLTMQSAWGEIADSTESAVSPVAHGVAHGALMGARGNSGVILSQIWRGMARRLDGKAVLTSADLAAAAEEGARTAYKGVMHPVEGTILTVVREAAEEAARAAADTSDLITVLERMVAQAREAVARTPTLLPVLAEAGVVDAGGQGFYVILEGMLHHLRGERMEEPRPTRTETTPAFSAPVPEEEGYGYDVQFIICGQGLDVEAIRRDIDAMGNSTLVVGDPTAVKVHVHVPDPGVPISYAVRLGSLRDVVVEDMQAQYQQFVRGKEAAAGAPPVTSELGVIAVAAGDGLARVFSSLGAVAVVSGGQTMNPSTEEILRAIESAPARQLIVLPNNKNIILAAQQAAGLSSKPVAVVPTRTIPQGVAALLALNYQAGLEENAQEMEEVIGDVRTGEVTTAVRSTTLKGVSVRQGEVIGLCDGQLVVSGPTCRQVVEALAEHLGVAEREIVTLYYGADVTPEEADELAATLRERYPDQEFEVVEGGQPHYFYIISAE